MKIEKTPLDGCVIVHTDIYGDDRGWFTESYNYQKYKELGITSHFVQDNHSMSMNKGTIRGMHFQVEPYAQTKLIRCVKGRIMDVVVDLRPSSSTYLKFFAIELSDKNHLQLYIPKGFAHGFVTLDDNTEIMYKVDQFYNAKADSGFYYEDPKISIPWADYVDVQTFIVSEKDTKLETLK